MATATKKYETIQEALAGFQSDLPKVVKGNVNPHFKNKYVSLEDLTAAVLPRLSEYGLSFSVGSFVQDGQMILDAHLLHTSGTSRSAQFPISETNPQKVGSAVSYYRRYALSALTGIVADEDDDGNSASAPAPAALRKAQERPAPKPKGSTGGTAQAAIREWIGSDEARKAQANALVDQFKKDGLSGDELYAKVKAELV